MTLQAIYTDRYFQKALAWPLIHEWEDVIAEKLDLPLIDANRASITTYYVDKAVRFASRKLLGSNKLLIIADRFINKKSALYFELLTRSSFYFTGSKNTVPVIIDFWKSINLDQFYNAYKNCKVVLISSREVYNYLKENNCPLNICHFPLSIADKYSISSNTVFNKTHDIIIPGRVDSVLLGYLKEYEKENPGVECLYRETLNGEFYYRSGKTGEVYRGQEREEYMNLLKSSKVTLYSTVGIDGDEQRTGGFSPVTPRFLEMISAGCQVIARYPKNAETEFYEMDSICVSCDTYAIFKEELSKALNYTEPNLKLYADYLSKHYTSNRVQLLSDILSKVK